MIDREHYTRVTEVLYPYSGLQHIDPKVLANAARRGTRVHQACEAIVTGEGAWGVDEEIAGYVKSFEKWWYMGHTVLAMEQRFFCDKKMITGQCDMILDTPQGAVILDIKTPMRPSKTWPLQGSAYAYLARAAGYNVSGIQFLKVDKNGKDPTVYNYKDEWEMFEKCLDVYNMFFKKVKNDHVFAPEN